MVLELRIWVWVSLYPHLSSSPVLYFSKFLVNLLSVSQFTKHFNCFVTFFFSFHCVFHDLGTRKKIGGGCQSDGVYHMSSLVETSPRDLSYTMSSNQWHYRSGHPPPLLLCQIGIPVSLSSGSECESCQLGEHHKPSFLVKFINVS